jgi:hypothetical protein
LEGGGRVGMLRGEGVLLVGESDWMTFLSLQPDMDALRSEGLSLGFVQCCQSVAILRDCGQDYLAAHGVEGWRFDWLDRLFCHYDL